MMGNNPKWTVTYKVINSSQYNGMGWEFFDTEEQADECVSKNEKLGYIVEKREFCESLDIEYIAKPRKLTLEEYEEIDYLIGKKVKKLSGKPFKNGERINTVKNILINPKTDKVALTFENDKSIVDLTVIEEI